MFPCIEARNRWSLAPGGNLTYNLLNVRCARLRCATTTSRQWQPLTDLSHVGWPEDGGDDQDVADDAADDDERVQRRQEVHREVRNGLIVHDVLKEEEWVQGRHKASLSSLLSLLLPLYLYATFGWNTNVKAPCFHSEQIFQSHSLPFPSCSIKDVSLVFSLSWWSSKYF